MEIEKFEITTILEEHRGILLLDFIHEHVHQENRFSKSQVRKFLKDGRMFIVSKKRKFSKPRYKIRTSDKVFILKTILPSNIESTKTNIFQLKPYESSLELIHEEIGFAIISKKRGIVVHPSNKEKCDHKFLVNILVHHFGGLNKLSNLEDDPLRPGIVHRLDRFTSGCMIILKTEEAHKAIKQQLMSHEKYIRREYITLVQGHFDKIKGVIDLEIGRHPTHYAKRIAKSQLSKAMEGKKENTFRDARTKYAVLEELECEGKRFSLVRCELFTGRTHQIRVHMSCVGHPIVGDTLYGEKWERQPSFIKKFLSQQQQGEKEEEKEEEEEKKQKKKKKRRKGKRNRRRGDYNLGGQVLHAEMIEFIHPDKFSSYIEEEEKFESDEESEGELDYPNEEEDVDDNVVVDNDGFIGGKDRVKFVCEIPEYFKGILEYIRENGKSCLVNTV